MMHLVLVVLLGVLSIVVFRFTPDLWWANAIGLFLGMRSGAILQLWVTK